MLTGQQHNDINRIWKEFWQNGMTDPPKKNIQLIGSLDADRSDLLKELQSILEK